MADKDYVGVQLWGERKDLSPPVLGSPAEGTYRAGTFKGSAGRLADVPAVGGVRLLQQGWDAGTGSYDIPVSELLSKTAVHSRPAAARMERLFSAQLGMKSAPSRINRALAAPSSPPSPRLSSEQGGIGSGCAKRTSERR